MKKMLAVFLLLGLIFGVSSSTFAAVLPIGDVFSVGSWAQGFNESGVGNFNQMGIWSLTGAGFEQSAFRGLSAGWTNIGTTIDSAHAIGPSTTDMTFSINFNGFSSSSLSFLFRAYEDLTAKESVVASWDGNGGWSFRPASYDELEGRGAIPEPATMTLLGMGLLGLFGLGKKRI